MTRIKNPGDITTTLIIVAALTSIAFILLFMFLDWLNLPIVGKDHTGSCVYIEYIDGSRQYGCNNNNLPHRYHSIVVASR